MEKITVEQVNKRLSIIQKLLKAPKGQYNSFGKYNYRSCEDILNAVKLLLGEGEAIVINDEMVQLGDRYYVKAKATLIIGDNGISAVAYARESLDKKGMDDAQITGATSSYARKYALNGLFAIDDTKDADTQDNRKDVNQSDEQPPEPTEEDMVHTSPSEKTCPDCGAVMIPGKSGRVYCKSCYITWAEKNKK